jgi:hypothetical protein
VLGSRHDLAVALDGNPAICQPELVDQAGNGGTWRDHLGLSVDDDVDRTRHRREATANSLTREAMCDHHDIRAVVCMDL